MIHVHLELPNEKIVRCELTRPRDNRLSGVVKIELSSLSSKINVLRAESKLKSVEGFMRTSIRSDKSHVERVAERNMKTLLDELPQGGNFRITGHY